MGRHDRHLPKLTREVRAKRVKPQPDDPDDNQLRRSTGERVKDDAKKAKKGDKGT